jgi:hypothetical protein
MIMGAILALLAACCVATSSVLAQQVWKVHCMGGPGVHFTDLPPAVAAASPGDTILVYATQTSTCSTYTAPTITKPLSILGFVTGGPTGNNNPTQVQLLGHLNITGMAAGEQVLISNFFIVHAATSFPPWNVGSPITATDCDGSIVFEDVDYYNQGNINQVIRFERCDHVVLRGCRFGLGGAPISFIDTTALLTTTEVFVQAPNFPGPYTVSTEALHLLRSHVTLCGSFVEGPKPYGSIPHRNGALLTESTLRIGASTVLRGGVLPGMLPPYSTTSYSAAWISSGPVPSVVERDPRAPAYSHFLPLPTLTPIDETFHDWIVANEWFQVRTYGPPGSTAMLFVGEMLFPTPLPPYGVLGVDPATALLFDTVSLTAPNGMHSWAFFCPPQIPVGFAFAFQTVNITPSGQISLTQPSPLTVAWNKSALP